MLIIFKNYAEQICVNKRELPVGNIDVLHRSRAHACDLWEQRMVLRPTELWIDGEFDLTQFYAFLYKKWFYWNGIYKDKISLTKQTNVKVLTSEREELLCV